MKILHICTTVSYGGAGKAALRLHLGLKSIGIQSKMLVLYPTSSDTDEVGYSHDSNIIRKLWNKLRARSVSAEFNSYKYTRPKGLDIFTDDRSIYDINKHPLVKDADIIHLHWVASMINYTRFFPNLMNKPLVWTLHDRNPITGGCHIPGECKKYETICGACPQLGSKKFRDLSNRIFKRKEKAYKGLNIHAITPSKWMAACVKKGVLFKNFEVNAIPYSLPASTFTARDKKFSRDLLNLPPDKTLILFGAAYKSENKGFAYLIRALKLLKDKKNTAKIGLVIFGNCVGALTEDLEYPIYRLGYIQDELLLSCVYSASDVFIMPSLEESFGQTALEAMACGVPVAGFKVSGLAELIKPGETGLLAQVKKYEELARQIEWLADHPEEREVMGRSARKVVEQEYTLQIQAKRYLKLYSSMLKDKKSVGHGPRRVR